jgi:putative redox protein
VILAAWVRKYLGELGHRPARSPASEGEVVARLSGEGLRTDVFAGTHALVADEPRDVGGTDAGASPYDLLTGALGSCTAMTLRMYASHKKWPLENVTVHLRHAKKHAEDCAGCDDSSARVDVIEREIELEGTLDTEQRARLLEIADRCPVHRTLHSAVVIRSKLREG